MPIALLVAALCAGFASTAVWLSFGGSGLMAFFIYVLSGHLMMAGMLSHAALRGIR